MKNIKLVIEYDGTNYLGWQRQPQGITVQEVLENTLERITKEKIKVTGSGRTDSGVHALAQAANFKTGSGMTAFEFQRALNSLLPKDIVIKQAAEADMDFHAQFDAKSKVYMYRILNCPCPSALDRMRAWFVPHSLNFSLMKKVSELLLDEHDFRAFALSGMTKTTVRRVLSANLAEKGGGIIEFEIEATGFLRGMVRIIIGTLVRVGREKMTCEDFLKALETGERTKFMRSAPPWGLFLKEVKY